MRRAEPGPVRTCVGCRKRNRVDDLVRITRADGSIRVAGSSRGRGAWICRAPSGALDPACVRLALSGRGFERAWRGALGDRERRELDALAHDGSPPADSGDAD